MVSLNHFSILQENCFETVLFFVLQFSITELFYFHDATIFKECGVIKRADGNRSLQKKMFFEVNGKIFVEFFFACWIFIGILMENFNSA